MGELKYNGSIGEDLFIEAQWLHIGKRRIVLWLFPLLMTLYAYMSHSHYLFMAVVFIIGSLFPLLFTRVINKLWRNVHKQSPCLRDTFSASITDDGVTFNNNSSSGLIPWSNITKTKESDSLLLLYQGPGLYNIIAKEFFSDSNDWNSAKCFIHTMLSVK